MTTDSSRCMICGHVRGDHMTCSSGAYWCNGPGCTCTKFDPADPKVEGTQGGEAHAGPGLVSEQRGSGADVTGPAGATDPTDVPAGPPDLHQAIQAARTAMLTGKVHLIGRSHADLAEAGVRAAWPVLLQAIRAENELLLERIEAHSIEGIRLENEVQAARAEAAEAGGDVAYIRWQLQATRDRHATLQTQVDQLRDLLERVEWGCGDCGTDAWHECCPLCGGSKDSDIHASGHAADCPLRAAILQTPRPTTEPSIHHEVQRLRDEVAKLRSALIRKDPRYEQAFREALDNPGDPITVEEFLAELAALDQAAPGEVEEEAENEEIAEQAQRLGLGGPS